VSKRRRILNFCALLCLPALQCAAVAQPVGETGDKSVRIVRTASAPVIDGVLDEGVWEQAGVLDDFHEVSPNEYEEPSQETRVYLLYDETHLYIGAQLLDDRADRIAAKILRQGSQVGNDDYFGVILDPVGSFRSMEADITAKVNYTIRF